MILYKEEETSTDYKIIQITRHRFFELDFGFFLKKKEKKKKRKRWLLLYFFDLVKQPNVQITITNNHCL